MKNKHSMLKNNCLMLKYVFKFCPRLVFYSLIYVITTVIKNIIEVVLISKAITLITTQTTFQSIFNGLIIYIIVLAVCIMYNDVYGNYIISKNQMVYQKNI